MTATPSPLAPESTDGRVERGWRSRRAVVEAAIGLIEEGVLLPNVAQVALRAGVSERSVFRHFQDVASLHEAVATVQMERIAALVVAVPPDGPLAARLDAFAEARAALLEANSPIRRSARLREPFYDEVGRFVDQARRGLRQQLEQTFAPELGRLGPADRAPVLEALDAATSWDVWEVLRTQQHLEVPAATAVMRRTMAALLGDAGAAGPEGRAPA